MEYNLLRQATLIDFLMNYLDTIFINFYYIEAPYHDK